MDRLKLGKHSFELLSPSGEEDDDDMKKKLRLSLETTNDEFSTATSDSQGCRAL